MKAEGERVVAVKLLIGGLYWGDDHAEDLLRRCSIHT